MDVIGKEVKNITLNGEFATVTTVDGGQYTICCRKERKMSVKETLLKDKGTGDTSKSKLTAIVFGLWNIACSVVPDLQPAQELVNGLLASLFGLFVRDAIKKDGK